MRASVTDPSPEVLPTTPVPGGSSRKRWILGILGLLAVVGVLAGVKAAQINAMIQAGASFVAPPETVTSAKVEPLDWEATRSAVGTVLALRAVTLGSEMSGIVRDIRFENGAWVKKGQVLVELDASSEAAQLMGAEAEAVLARSTRARIQKLHEQGANTPSDLESAEARAVQAEATVANLRVLIGKKSIRAPFDGRVGIRQVELGQIVSPGSPIASLHSMTPALVEFLLPQQVLAEVKSGQKVRVHVDVFPGETWAGELTTINPEVESSSRNVRMRATVPNEDGRLMPGMFASVEVVAGERRPVVAIPSTSVIFAPYGDSVYVLDEAKDAAGKPGLVARQRFVRLGERRGDFVAVTSGLNAGESVASSGVFKLRNGAAVVINNALAPPVESAPQVVNP